MKTVKAERLKKGDLVTVFSPSQPISNSRNFWRGVRTLQSLEFKVETGKHVETVLGMYEAGTPEQRAADFNRALVGRKIRAIFMSCGGFLANKILPLLDYDLIRKNPKIIVGFSDGTTFLNAIYAKTGLVTFYGFSIERFFTRATKYTVESFLNIVQDGKTDFQPKTRWKILRKGRATGKLIGGNLLSFANLLGTSYFPDATNSILFLEEHDDYSEDIENSLVRLINAGLFEKDMVQGVVLGKMINITVGSGDPETHKLQRPKHFTFYRIVKNLLKPCKVPILANVDFGLTYKLMTIPIGIEAFLDLTKGEPVFELKEPAIKTPQR